MKFGVRLGNIRHLANTIVLIGLIGTVIGFIIALSGVAPMPLRMRRSRRWCRP